MAPRVPPSGGMEHRIRFVMSRPPGQTATRATGACGDMHPLTSPWRGRPAMDDGEAGVVHSDCVALFTTAPARDAKAPRVFGTPSARTCGTRGGCFLCLMGVYSGAGPVSTIRKLRRRRALTCFAIECAREGYDARRLPAPRAIARGGWGSIARKGPSRLPRFARSLRSAIDGPDDEEDDEGNAETAPAS